MGSYGRGRGRVVAVPMVKVEVAQVVKVTELPPFVGIVQKST